MESFQQARLTAHWALQVPCAIASGLVPPQADDSHSNFGWHDQAKALMSHQIEVASGKSLRVGLRLGDLEVVIMDDDHPSGSVTLPIDGATLGESLAAVRSSIAQLAGGELGPTPLRDYDMPEHPVASGEPFAVASNSLLPLEGWYSRFSLIWQGVAAELAVPMQRSKRLSLSAARVWPHHFDYGGLLTLSENESIGFGLSPGDDTFERPYLYVNAYPAPESPPLLESGLASWNTQGFRGFVAHEATLTTRGDEELASEIAALILAFAGI